jgi:hypothetical protein
MDPRSFSLSAAQGTTATVALNVLNTGVGTIDWNARSNSSWLSLNPTISTSTEATPGIINITVSAAGLTTGVYSGNIVIASTGVNLDETWELAVTLTVTPGDDTSGGSTNLFGLPTSPEEGSPNGVTTPTGLNVTVVPVRDFLVRFTNVTVAGRTKVTVTSSANTLPQGSGVRYGPWIYTVQTTAQYTGPVTVAVAYENFSPASQGALRLSSGNRDLTVKTELARQIIWGSPASLPDGFFIFVPPVTLSTLAASPGLPAAAGTSISFSATASSSGTPVNYKFWRYSAASGWTVVQDYSPSSTLTWNTGRSDAGSYALQVWVRRPDSSATYEDWRGLSFTITPPAPLTITKFASDETIPAPAGRTITWTATTAGGFGPLQYKFWRKDGDAAWQIVQDYGASPSYAWNTTSADTGTHVLQVWARSADSVTAYDAWQSTGFFTLGSPAPLAATMLASSVPLPTPAGTSITWMAGTTGGLGPLQFKFWRYDANTGWNVVRDYGASNKYTWATGGGDVGSHAVQVWVRNAGSTSAYDAWQGTSFFTISSPPSPVISAFTASVVLPAPAGSWITWTANATGGYGPLEYKFWLYSQSSGWAMVQDYGSSNQYTWASRAEDAGSHALQVWVRTVGSTALYEAYNGTSLFNLTGPPAVTVTALTSSPSGPFSVGQTVTFTATANGGYGPLQFKFWRYDSTGWSLVQDYSSSNTYTWSTGPGDGGTHALQVWVRSNGSTTTYDAWRGIDFRVNP